MLLKKIKLKNPYLLLLPSLLTIIVIIGYPTIQMVRYSFLNWRFGKGIETASWVGFENYQWLFTSQSSTFYHALKITIIYAVSSIILELIFGMFIALLIRKNIYARPVVITSLLLPTLLMPVMVGMMWRMYLYPSGIVNYILQSLFNITINWYEQTWALPAVILVEVWQFTPFFIIALYAGLQALPEEILEAASVDGTNGWQRFFHIILPLLKPVIIVCIIIRSMWILRAFDIIYVMYSGGPGSATEVLGLAIYRAIFMQRNIGRASAISVLLVILVLLMTFVFYRIFYRESSLGS